jgi:hypothetical protein
MPYGCKHRRPAARAFYVPALDDMRMMTRLTYRTDYGPHALVGAPWWESAHLRDAAHDEVNGATYGASQALLRPVQRKRCGRRAVKEHDDVPDRKPSFLRSTACERGSDEATRPASHIAELHTDACDGDRAAVGGGVPRELAEVGSQPRKTCHQL